MCVSFSTWILPSSPANAGDLDQPAQQTTLEEQKKDQSSSDKVQERGTKRTAPTPPKGPPSDPTKTPSPGGPVPIPYPNTTEERK